MLSLQLLNIDPDSRKPKYLQIVEGVIQNISNGNLKIDERLPSINNFSEEFYLSRDTVEKAYGVLKEQKVIVSVKGKGYYINRTNLISKTNVLFLVNKLSNYKMHIYNSFVSRLGVNGHTDLHIYHCDEDLFLNLLSKSLRAYDYYIIMPHFKDEQLKHRSYTPKVTAALKKINTDKLIILDNNKTELNGDFVEIYQDFENDIQSALTAGLDKIKKYKKAVLVYPDNTVYPYPRRILHGFRKFCVFNQIDFEIYNEIYEDMILKEGDLFITIEESHLVSLLKQIKQEGLHLGQEIGVISYNETPLKELLGITVISTDFKAMGETAAEMILTNKKGKIKNPFSFIDRESV